MFASRRRRSGSGSVSRRRRLFLPLVGSAEMEHLAERLTELAAHRTVQDEIDGAVEQYDDVEDVAEWNVDGREDARVDAAQERQDALRQFGDDEAQYDGDEHGCRPDVFAGSLRLVAATGRTQPTTLLGRSPHR